VSLNHLDCWHARPTYPSGPLTQSSAGSVTLVTAQHRVHRVGTSQGCWSRAWRQRGLAVRGKYLLTTSWGDAERVDCAFSTAARGARRCATVDSVSTWQGKRPRCESPDTKLFKINVGGTQASSRRHCEPRSRCRSKRVDRRNRPRGVTARRRRDTDLPRRPLRPALPQLQARGRREALRLLRRRGCLRDRPILPTCWVAATSTDPDRDRRPDDSWRKQLPHTWDRLHRRGRSPRRGPVGIMLATSLGGVGER